MKKTISLISLIAILFCGCGCVKKAEIKNRFITVGVDGKWRIIVDNETKVMYLKDAGVYQGGITAILNSDGTPMLWEGE